MRGLQALHASTPQRPPNAPPSPPRAALVAVAVERVPPPTRRLFSFLGRAVVLLYSTPFLPCRPAVTMLVTHVSRCAPSAPRAMCWDVIGLHTYNLIRDKEEEGSNTNNTRFVHARGRAPALAAGGGAGACCQRRVPVS